MSSTGADRSISNGMSLPQWMKTKMGDQYDLDQPAFSPSAEDDSFFFIRYPRAMHQPDFGNLCNDVKTKVVENKQSTIPCQRFLAEIQAEGAMLRRPSVAAKPLKLFEGDGGFKSEKTTVPNSINAHRSVVEVAHDVVGGGLLGLGRDNAATNNYLMPSQYNFRHRRNSKSLPASPLSSPNTSPKLRRKNPYFSDPFGKSNDNFGKAGWLLSNILSQRASVEDLVSGTESTNSEAESPDTRRRQQDTINILKTNTETKPSELREMNFWSPTSM